MRETVSRDGTHVAYSIEGFGPPLILLHGFASNQYCWQEMGYLDALVGAGRQVITIDARGHGDSGKPHRPELYAFHKRAQDVIAVLDALDLRAADLHGFSMGGWIAIATARAFPARVRSLSVTSAHGFAESLEPSRRALRGGLESWIAMLEADIGTKIDPERKAQLLGNDPNALRASIAEDRPDLAGALPESRFQALVFCGTREPVLEKCEAFARSIAGQFVRLQGKNESGAFCAVNQVCSALIPFLEENDHAHFSELLADGRSAKADRLVQPVIGPLTAARC